MEIQWNKFEVLDQENSKASKGHVKVCRQEFRRSIERFQELPGVSCIVAKSFDDQLWTETFKWHPDVPESVEAGICGTVEDKKFVQHPDVSRRFEAGVLKNSERSF